MMMKLICFVVAVSICSAAIHAQLVGGPYVIQPLDMNGGGTTSTGGPYSISASTGQAGGVGTIVAEPIPAPPLYQFDDGFWSTIGPAPPTEPPTPHDRAKNRYVSFAPNSGTEMAALRIDKVTAPTGSGWVGAPDANGISQVVAIPVTRVWTEPVVHVGDCAIVPVATYEIRATADEGGTFSSALTVSTTAQPVPKFWADTVGAFGNVVAGQWDPPNGVVNVNDYVAALQKFLGLSTAPHVTVVDVQAVSSTDPCLNRVANIADVFLIIKAFQGNVYPFETNPANCPSCP